jgi:predicted TIM-barrel fold metal-dependent hydrolase
VTEIIDAHCHILRLDSTWSPKMAQAYLDAGVAGTPVWWDPSRMWTVADQEVDVDRLVSHMDEAGVDRAVVFGFAARPYDCRADDTAIVEAVERYPGRFVPFHAVDPFGGVEARRLLERRLVEDGFQGLKLAPAYSHIGLADPLLYPVYARAEDLGVPVIVHTGSTRLPGALLRWQDPLDLDAVGAAFPGLRLWLAHCGMYRWEDAFAVLARHPAMVADVSFWGRLPRHVVAAAVAQAKHIGVLDRLMWGTDYPFWGPAGDLARWRVVPADQVRHGLEPALDDDDLAGLLGGNAARLLGSRASSNERGGTCFSSS